MKLRRATIRNFRCFKDEISVDFDSVTALIGKNDAGKSAILQALEIFFDQKKPDADDAAKHGDRTDMAITCEFDELPTSLILDATSQTNLTKEHLLNSENRLEIVKVFNGSLKTPSMKTSIRALHPSVEGAGDLLALKLNDLKNRAVELSVDLTRVNQTISADIREAIRIHVGDLKLEERLIDVDTYPGAKELYPHIKAALPAFFLFRSDRSSTDQDSEAQDPMKVMVKLAIEQQKESLDHIASEVKKLVSDLVDQTLVKIEAIAPEIAGELTPDFSDPKWESVFKIALTSDAEIPLNKRGSGVRRLVLLGFLQAQAESSRLLAPDSGVIYAIEEPETSQHPDMQRSLLLALEGIADQDGYQVILTTHTPMLGRLLPASTLRYIAVDGKDRTMHPPSEETMGLVARALGVLPDHDVRVFVGIEGKNDETFLRTISAILSFADATIGNLAELEDAGKLIFIPVGGSNVGLWVSRLHHLNRSEYHIFDRDVPPPAQPHYESYAVELNQRQNCVAVHTSKRELENYLHPDAIKLARPEVTLISIADFDDVPLRAAQQIHAASGSEKPWEDVKSDEQKKKVNQAKKWLNKDAVGKMTYEMLQESDPNGDVIRWLREITERTRNEVV